MQKTKKPASLLIAISLLFSGCIGAGDDGWTDAPPPAVLQTASPRAAGQGTASAGTVKGALKFSVTERGTGQHVPAKLVFLQEGVPAPLGLASKGTLASRGHVVYAATGSGTVPLAPGNYEIWTGRGPEYDADVQTIEIAGGDTAQLSASIARVVDTRGFVAADLHLHTATFSGHGDATLEERVIACLAEGLDWAVATDHNHQTDYQPALQSLRSEARLLTTVGDEISSMRFHANVFPANHDPAEVSKTMIDAPKLFGLLRSNSPDGVIQVNHPRAATSAFFDTYNLDPFTGLFRDRGLQLDFDALEVLNGDDGHGWPASRRVLRSPRDDWFHLLNSGYRPTAVGNSDSHSLLDGIAGVPRTYVAASNDTPGALSEAELLQSIKDGSVVINRGLFVTLGPADQQGAGKLLRLKKGGVRLAVRVQAPSWVDADSLFVYGNGALVARYGMENTEQPIRFDRVLTLQPERDTWYVACASGDRPMRPLVTGTAAGATPLGFTNPVRVDADGDGVFTSVRERASRLADARPHPLPQSITDALANEPGLVPYVVDLYAGSPPDVRFDVFTTLLRDADFASRLMIYERLSELKTTRVASLLSSAETEAAWPLEFAAIRLARFKVNRNRPPEADPKLNLDEARYLFKIFTNYQAGSRIASWHTAPGESAAQAAPAAKVFRAPAHGVIEPRVLENCASDASGTIFLRIFARQRGPMRVLVRGLDNTALSVEGQKPSSDWAPHSRQRFQIAEISLSSGENLIELSWRAGEMPDAFVFEPIDPDGILDPSMAAKQKKAHQAVGRTVHLLTQPHAARRGGENALLDGFLGSEDRRDGYWMGFEGEHFEAIVDLGSAMPLNRVSTSYLQVSGAWIFLPEWVEYAISADGVSFETAARVQHELQTREQGHFIYDFAHEFESPAHGRYVRVRAKSVRDCPDWHPGAGFPAWLFVDEIQID